MDDEVFGDWDSMDMSEDFVNSFLSFEHSSLTEAIISSSMYPLHSSQNDHFDDAYGYRNNGYESYPIKKEKEDSYMSWSETQSVSPSYVYPSPISSSSSSSTSTNTTNSNNTQTAAQQEEKVSTPQTTRNNNCQWQSNEQNSKKVDIVIDEQPPVEVRTRTPGENRTFSLKATVVGNYYAMDIHAVRVNLLYSNCRTSSKPKQTILGGNKTVPIQEDGSVHFDNLCLNEASTKHEEREFALEFVYVLSNGQEVNSERRTTQFYAYSHKKVLTRRKNVTLRALSKHYGPMSGGGEIHVVGSPFIKGPSLKCVFRTPHGEIELKYSEGHLDRYSETVMFFELPAYPQRDFISMLPEGTEIKTEVVVTNDGRHYSGPLEFIYYAGRSKTRH